MIIRREAGDDVEVIRAVTAAAFARPDEADVAVQAWLVDELRSDEGWIPSLSLVAVIDGEVVGHVVCTRAHVDDTPALGLGPLSVHPDFQNRGVGTALVHTVLGAADALGEPLVILLGSPAYYGRFGFRPAAQLGITMPGPWGNDFQVRTLGSYEPSMRGTFRFAAPFDAV